MTLPMVEPGPVVEPFETLFALAPQGAPVETREHER